MDNPETLATLDTQDTGRRQSKHTIKTKHNTACSTKNKKDKLYGPNQKPA